MLTIFVALAWICYFCDMIRTQDKSRRYSIAMLLVYVPMVLLSSLHIHQVVPVAQVACGHCVEQTAHQAHLSSLQSIDTDECLLCRFLVTMAAPMVVMAIVGSVRYRALVAVPLARVSRGPPCR